MSEVEEAERRIREWKASPEAKEEGAVCPIAEVRTLRVVLPGGFSGERQTHSTRMSVCTKNSHFPRANFGFFRLR